MVQGCEGGEEQGALEFLGLASAGVFASDRCPGGPVDGCDGEPEAEFFLLGIIGKPSPPDYRGQYRASDKPVSMMTPALIL